MAITITQQPTSPNAAYTRLLNVVSGSTNTGNPQYSYIMDVYESGSSDKIVRIIQGINPAGVSVFDPSRIIQGQLAEDQSWKISSVTPFESGSKLFTLKFGEQYGTSDSSSITEYPDLAENVIEVFRGVVEPNDGSYNWPSSSYAVLSNMPSTMSMQTNDYGTISLYNNDISYVSQSFYSSSVSGSFLVQNKSYSITDNFSSVPISASTPYWNNAQVDISSSLGIQSYRYEVSDETHREKVRFAFINKLGAWDYFNNYNPVQQTTAVNREQYTANRVDYSSLTSTYDITRRGLSDFYCSKDDSFTVQTDYLDKENANWLEELIESPSVFIQRDGEFVPIVVLNSSYTANTNQARQKLFQYTLEFIPSNQPFGKWVPEYVECPKIQPVLPNVETNPITDIDYLSLTLNGNVTYDGGGTISGRGFDWNTGSSPTISDNDLPSGTGTGIFSSSLTGLDTGSTYYVRAYAINEIGLIYGNEVNATTLQCVGNNVVTNNITDVDYGGFTMNGELTCDNPLDPNVERGFVYSGTNANPSVSASNVVKVGSGPGIFSSSLTCLTSSTDYYVRAYASSSGALYYGDIKEATTSQLIEPILTSSVSGSLYRDLYLVTFEGDLTTGSVTIEERGIAFSSQSTLPDVSSSNSFTQSVAGGPSGSYELVYTASNPSTEWYGRAYAKYNYCGNEEVFYGNVASSSTPAFTGSLRELDPYGAGTIASSSLLYWYDFTTRNELIVTSSTSLEDFGKVIGVRNKGTVVSASLSASFDSNDTLKYGANHYLAPTIEQGYVQFYGGDNINSTLAHRYGDLGFTGSSYPGFSSSSLTTAVYFSWVDLDEIRNGPNIQYIGMPNPGPYPFRIFNISYLVSHEQLGVQGGEKRWYSSTSSSYDLIGSEVEIDDISSFEHNMATYYSYSGSNNAWQSTYLIVSGSPIIGRTDYGNGEVTSSRAPGETEVSLNSNKLLYGGAYYGEGLAIGGAASFENKGNNNFKLAHFLLYTGSLTSTQLTNIINDFSASVTYGEELNSISN